MADKASVQIKLENDIQVNGVKIPAGTQDVPAEVASDYKRIDREHSNYLAGLNKNNGESALNAV
jgi:hypothetical protein